MYSEREQRGNTFGERISNALTEVYAKGYDQAIIIGNDTPHLTTEHILSAVGKLENNPLVMGPSTDGGFYLLGLRQTHYNEEQFVNLPWKTSRLSTTILSTLSRKQKNPSLLEILIDLDSKEDLKHLLATEKPITSRIRLLVRMLLTSIRTLPYKKLRYHSIISSSPHNKGSPQLICI